MKYSNQFLIALFLVVAVVVSLFTLQSTTYAQDTSPVPVETPVVEQPPPLDELPDTAAGALPYLREWLLFVAALVSTHIMNGVKKLPGLGGKEWFAKLVTELVAGVSASVVAFLLGTASVALGFLDQSGLWQVIVFAWPAAVGIYHGKKFGRLATVNK